MWNQGWLVETEMAPAVLLIMCNVALQKVADLMPHAILLYSTVCAYSQGLRHNMFITNSHGIYC